MDGEGDEAEREGRKWVYSEVVGNAHFHVKGLQLLCRSEEIIHALF